MSLRGKLSEAALARLKLARQHAMKRVTEPLSNPQLQRTRPSLSGTASPQRCPIIRKRLSRGEFSRLLNMRKRNRFIRLRGDNRSACKLQKLIPFPIHDTKRYLRRVIMRFRRQRDLRFVLMDEPHAFETVLPVVQTIPLTYIDLRLNAQKALALGIRGEQTWWKQFWGYTMTGLDLFTANEVIDLLLLKKASRFRHLSFLSVATREIAEDVKRLSLVDIANALAVCQHFRVIPPASFLNACANRTTHLVSLSVSRMRSNTKRKKQQPNMSAQPADQKSLTTLMRTCLYFDIRDANLLRCFAQFYYLCDYQTVTKFFPTLEEVTRALTPVLQLTPGMDPMDAARLIMRTQLITAAVGKQFQKKAELRADTFRVAPFHWLKKTLGSFFGSQAENSEAAFDPTIRVLPRLAAKFTFTLVECAAAYRVPLQPGLREALMYYLASSYHNTAPRYYQRLSTADDLLIPVALLDSWASKNTRRVDNGINVTENSDTIRHSATDLPPGALTTDNQNASAKVEKIALYNWPYDEQHRLIELFDEIVEPSLQAILLFWKIMTPAEVAGYLPAPTAAEVRQIEAPTVKSSNSRESSTALIARNPTMHSKDVLRLNALGHKSSSGQSKDQPTLDSFCFENFQQIEPNAHEIYILDSVVRVVRRLGPYKLSPKGLCALLEVLALREHHTEKEIGVVRLGGNEAPDDQEKTALIEGLCYEAARKWAIFSSYETYQFKMALQHLRVKNAYIWHLIHSDAARVARGRQAASKRFVEHIKGSTAMAQSKFTS